MVRFLGRRPCEKLPLSRSNHFAEGSSLYFSVDLGARWERRRYTALEGVIIHNGRGLLGSGPDSCPTAHVCVHLSQTADPEHPQSLTRWQRRWSVVESLSTCRHLSRKHSTHAQSYNITPSSGCYSSAVKAELMEPSRQTSLYSPEWKSEANREDFSLCVWVLSVDLLLYSAVVSHSDVSTRKGHCGIWKQLYSYFSLYLRSALRMPNCLLGCFHKSCRGATNPVFIHCLLALT